MGNQGRGFWWGLLKLIIMSSVVFGFFGAIYFLISRWRLIALVAGVGFVIGIVAIGICVYIN